MAAPSSNILRINVSQNSKGSGGSSIFIRRDRMACLSRSRQYGPIPPLREKREHVLGPVAKAFTMRCIQFRKNHRAVFFDQVLPPTQREQLCSFDIHFDEIDAPQSKLFYHGVDLSKGNFGDFWFLTGFCPGCHRDGI